jgi:hypothetical protein
MKKGNMEGLDLDNTLQRHYFEWRGSRRELLTALANRNDANGVNYADSTSYTDETTYATSITDNATETRCSLQMHAPDAGQEDASRAKQDERITSIPPTAILVGVFSAGVLCLAGVYFLLVYFAKIIVRILWKVASIGGFDVDQK